MQGDFSRDSFDPLRRYSRVLQQQGRVELDADGNERQAIQLHLLRQLAADLIGPSGGPGDGFAISDRWNGKPMLYNFAVSPGHYYVNGWLCENDDVAIYNWDAPAPAEPAPARQRQVAVKVPPLEAGNTYLVVLDVWERHVSAAEADGAVSARLPGALREVALGGPDTASRAQVVWQLRVSNGAVANGKPLALPAEPYTAAGWRKWFADVWPAWLALWSPEQRGRLMARASDPGEAEASSPCVVAPQSRYRGVENQLYRIQVHRGGRAGELPAPTFVWSRENGSVVYAISRIAGRQVKLADGWRDTRFALSVGDWVELLDEGLSLNGSPGRLHRVTEVDIDTSTVTLDATPAITTDDPASHPVLVRWDHGGRRPLAANAAKPSDDGGLVIDEGRWLGLEDGVQVWFEPPEAKGDVTHYRAGDYWLVPARVAVGDVLWPRDTQSAPLPQPPRGVDHQYAPLGVVKVAADGVVSVAAGETPRRQFRHLVDL